MKRTSNEVLFDTSNNVTLLVSYKFQKNKQSFFMVNKSSFEKTTDNKKHDPINSQTQLQVI